MNLILKRYILTETETQGVLTVGGSVFFTIEQPWKDNLKGHSCVPLGTYALIPHSSEKHPNTWALDNPALKVYAEPAGNEPDDARTDCLIHPANWAFQLEGCIAPGMGKADSDKGPMVTRSREAFGTIQKLLGIGSTGHTLEIIQ
jgi:hypothetical protein